YALYDDLSRRVMRILGDFTQHLEIYSVDEAFLEITGVGEEELPGLARKIQETVLQQTGIPVGVGVSTTKVLAKLANRLSKKTDGICLLVKEDELERALKETRVKEIWGIGRKSGDKLISLKI